MKLACLMLFVGLLPMAARADLTGRVVAVADGDTLTVLVNEREQIQVRLAGVRAPERNLNFGKQSQSSLSALAFGREVRVDGGSKDSQGYFLARLWVADASCRQAECPKNIDVGLTQIASGMARYDQSSQKEQSPLDRQSYAQAEFTAKIRRLGLWAGKSPVAPGAWLQHRLDE